MNVAGIVQLPDPALRFGCTAVTEFGDETVRRVAQELLAAAREPGRAGVAAPQLGYALRIFAADLGAGPKVFVNPRVTYGHGTLSAREGCLSVAERWFYLARPAVVTLDATDEHCKAVKLTLTGHYARVACHETDHLDGILVVDRAREQMSALPRQQRRAVERELAKAGLS